MTNTIQQHTIIDDYLESAVSIKNSFDIGSLHKNNKDDVFYDCKDTLESEISEHTLIEDYKSNEVESKIVPAPSEAKLVDEDDVFYDCEDTFKSEISEYTIVEDYKSNEVESRIVPAPSEAKLLDEDFELIEDALESDPVLIDRPEPIEKNIINLTYKTIYFPNNEQLAQNVRERLVIDNQDTARYSGLMGIIPNINDNYIKPITALPENFRQIDQVAQDAMKTKKLLTSLITVGTLATLAVGAEYLSYQLGGGLGLISANALAAAVVEGTYKNFHQPEVKEFVGKIGYGLSYIPGYNIPATNITTPYKKTEAAVKWFTGANIPSFVTGIAGNKLGEVVLRKFDNRFTTWLASSLEQTQKAELQEVGKNVGDTFKTVLDKNSYEAAGRTINTVCNIVTNCIPQVEQCVHEEINIDINSDIIEPRKSWTESLKSKVNQVIESVTASSPIEQKQSWVSRLTKVTANSKCFTIM